MQRQTILVAIAAAAAIVAAGLVLIGGATTHAPAPVPQSRESEPASPRDAPIQLASADAPAPRNDEPAAAKVRELEAMSETFRNSTLLIAIRDAGFVCNELLRVYGGLDHSGNWTATCSEMLAYTVSVASTGALRVEPMLQYFDGVVWPVAPEQGGDPIKIPSDRPLLDRLPPQTR